MVTLAPIPTTSQLGLAQLGAMQLGRVPSAAPGVAPVSTVVFVSYSALSPLVAPRPVVAPRK